MLPRQAVLRSGRRFNVRQSAILVYIDEHGVLGGDRLSVLYNCFSWLHITTVLLSHQAHLEH
jgi:hypothetical protein